MEAREPWGRSWRGTAVLLILLAATVAVLLVRAPWREEKAGPPDPDRLAGELAHLKMLGRALKLHADEHEGRYPATIGDIEWRQAQPGMDANGLPATVSRFHRPDTGAVADWLYYTGHTESDPAETILVASPVAVGVNGDQRLVTRINNVTEALPETEFQRQMKPPL